MKKIERVSVTDEVVSSIKSLILSAECGVGDKLPTESHFCKQLGVGRSSVRESLRVLQALGFIEIRSGKGAFVRAKIAGATVREWFIAKEADVEALMEVRLAIEPLAARLAIARAKAGQIASIEAVHAEFAIAVAESDVTAMASLDEAFHNAIMEASNNPLLIRIGGLMAESLMEYRIRSFAVTENTSHALVPHARIVKAIVGRNEAEAVVAMLNHLEVTLADMRSVIRAG